MPSQRDTLPSDSVETGKSPQSYLYDPSTESRVTVTPQPRLVVSSSGRFSLESQSDFSSNRFELLSLEEDGDDLPSASDSSGRHGGDNNDERDSGEGAVVARQHSSNDGSDNDVDIGDPFLTDRFGNLTSWRLSDLEAAADNYLEDEESETEVEEKKYSKKEMLKRDADRKKQYMEYALQKYNNDEDLAGEMRFVFDESKDEVFIIEGNMNFYEHFNFTAKQAGSTVLFFAEVIPDEGELCDVLCCKPLDSDDNGHCFGCKNQGSVDLRHPAGGSLYVGGHVDCEFPFMWDSISEDDSD